MKNLALIISLCFFAVTAQASVPAGSIGEIKGSGVIERDKEVIEGTTGVGVQMQDTAVTANGRMRIDFKDQTRVDLTEHARLVIDEFVYDPANDVGSLSIKATLGGVRYASGQIAKRYQQNVKIRTPSATIGVRGTDFVMVVDEMGGSMITLLPSCDVTGYCYTGEIEVETDVGIVVMNQAFQSTMTSTRMQPPSPPLLIDADENMLNQLLILRKKNPYVEAEELEHTKKAMFDFLGLDMLQFDGLNDDLLNVDDIWVTTLDESDYLLADLLHDMLDQLNAALMAIFKSELDRQNEIMLAPEDVGKYGFDPDTGIRLDKTGTGWKWTREDNGNNNYISIKMSDQYSYSLNVEQGDFTIYDYRLGTSSGNSIDIKQSN